VAEIRVVFSTAPADIAAGLVRTLVEEGLVACGNIVPGVRSIYAWKGEVCDEAEVVLLLETSAARIDTAIARLRALHPYEVPKIVVIDPVAVDDAYAAWVLATTSASRVDVDA
jgi:periplasmic divalent cation tolerance protein